MSIKGRVAWYNVVKCFGAIVPIGGGEEIYVHRSELIDCKRLHKGQYVRYEPGENERGKCAREVRVIFNAKTKTNAGRESD